MEAMSVQLIIYFKLTVKWRSYRVS